MTLQQVTHSLTSLHSGHKLKESDVVHASVYEADEGSLNDLDEYERDAMDSPVITSQSS